MPEDPPTNPNNENENSRNENENSFIHSLVRASSYSHSFIDIAKKFSLAQLQSPESRLLFAMMFKLGDLMERASEHKNGLNLVTLDRLIKKHLNIFFRLTDRQAISAVREICDVMTEGMIVSKGFLHSLLHYSVSKSTCRKHLKLLEEIGYVQLYSCELLTQEVQDTTVYLGETLLYGLPGLGPEAYIPLINWMQRKSQRARKRRGWKITDQSLTQLDRKEVKAQVLKENVEVKQMNKIVDYDITFKRKAELIRQIKAREDWLSNIPTKGMSPRVIATKTQQFQTELLKLRQELASLEIL